MNANIDVMDVVLKTERLVLRPWRAEDLEDFYEYASVDGVGQMAGWMPHRDVQESRRILDSFIAGRKTFALVHEGKVIGSLGIEKYVEEYLPEYRDRKGRELGYVLSRNYWGQGLMTEAVRAVIRYLFETVGLDFIVCGHFTENDRSRRVQEKCGFRHVKLVAYETRYGVVKDCWISVLERANAARIERIVKPEFTVIGREGSTRDGANFIPRLWEEANARFAEIEVLCKREEDRSFAGFWGAMSDFSRSFRPWDNFAEGLYLAGAECVDGAEAPEGWTKWVIPGFEYLRFAQEAYSFAQAADYVRESGLSFAGAAHDFNDPRTGKGYICIPIRKL